MGGRRLLDPLAATLFFVSGALGLGYELIWIRKAALIVGASQIALSTVLTSFFVGLGTGGLVIGRYGSAARRSPLLLYGLFEIGIGLWALAFPWLFEGVERLYGLLVPSLSAGGAGLFALRFALLFGLCLPPTFLMGGTLPLLLDALVRDDRGIGPRTGLLYGLNVLGAVCGVLATAYLAIPALGMNGTSRFAGACNLAVGGIALVCFRGVRAVHRADAPAERPGATFVALAFTAGAVAIGWQTCHARYFSLLDVTTVYTTALLLAVWLFGLASGSLALAPILGRRLEPLRVVAAAQGLVPVLGLFALDAAGWVDFSPQLGVVRAQDGSLVPIDTMQVLPRHAFFSETMDAILFGPLLRTGLVVFAPVALMGACLPALIAGATARSSALRSVSGTLVFWNTLGCAAGAFLAGYLLLPALGLHGSLATLGLTSIAVGAVAWKAAPPGPPLARLPLAGALAAGAAAVAAFALFVPDPTRRVLERHGYGRADDRQSVEVVEDPIVTAYVHEDHDRLLIGAGAVAMAVAAKHGPSPQAIQGHLPLLLFGAPGVPRRCLGIGLGSGQSFGALLLYPIESLDVVDVSPGLVELSLRRFAQFNHGLAHDRRVRFHLDDGRHFVGHAAEGTYDLVSMEPPPPTADGVFSLYSLDFYRQVRRCLSDRGVFMQWLPLYRLSPRDALGILRTQTEAFPESFVVKHGDEDFVVLSFKRRPTFSIDEIRRRARVFSDERSVAGHRWGARCRFEIASFEGVASAILAGPDALRGIEAAVYADDTQRLAYGSGDRWLLERYRPHVSRLTFAGLPESPWSELARYFEPPLDAERIAMLDEERAAALEFFDVSAPARLESWRRLAEQGAELSQRVRGQLALAAAHDVRLQKSAAFERVRAALALDPANDAPADVALVRRIARNHFAVFRAETLALVADLRSRLPQAPLARAMATAVDEVERLEQQRRARYLFPER